MNRPVHPADEFGINQTKNMKQTKDIAEKQFKAEGTIDHGMIDITQNKDPNIASNPLLLIATDVLAAPFGLMLEFGEQLEKAKSTKIEGSPAVANAYMMHVWAKTIIEEFKKSQEDNQNVKT